MGETEALKVYSSQDKIAVSAVIKYDQRLVKTEEILHDLQKKLTSLTLKFSKIKKRSNGYKKSLEEKNCEIETLIE